MMRLALVLSIAFAGLASAADSDKKSVELSGVIEGRGLPMAECDTDVRRIQLSFKLDKKGDGAGTLVLDCTPNPVDEFGFPITIKAVPPVKLDCTIKLVQTKKVLTEGPIPPVAAGAVEVDWELFEVTGPKIVSKISLAREAGPNWPYARFVWASKEGKNRMAIMLHGPAPAVDMQRIQPCHPGCFPSGTPIQIPGGAKAVEDLRAGDTVTTVGADGKAGKGKIAAMFVTRNLLVEVNIEGKTLITTETQPLSLADGKLKAAGELKAGDRIYAWSKGERTVAAVKSVVATGREARVYNLVLGDPVLFVADGFLARSKPPAVVIAPPRP
jgi:hypothetical protein